MASDGKNLEPGTEREGAVTATSTKSRLAGREPLHKQWQFWALLAVSVGLMALGRYFSGELKWEYRGDFVFRVGEAGLIAMAVYVFFHQREQAAIETEFASRAEEMRAIVVKFLEDLVPPTVRQALKQQILDPGMLRKGFELVLQLSHEAGRGERIRVEFAVQYTLQNTSNLGRDYTVRLHLDEKEKGDAEITKVVLGNQPLLPDEIKQKTRTSHLLRAFEYKGSMEANESLEVELHGYQWMRRADTVPWFMVDVCTSFKIAVCHPRDLAVTVSPVHPVLQRMDDFHRIAKEGFVGARIDEVLLPYQGIDVKWEPVPEPAATARPDAPAKNQKSDA